jgi:hypothetical protein
MQFTWLFLSWRYSLLENMYAIWQYFTLSRTSFKLGVNSLKVYCYLSTSLCNILAALLHFWHSYTIFTRSGDHLRKSFLWSSTWSNSSSINAFNEITTIYLQLQAPILTPVAWLSITSAVTSSIEVKDHWSQVTITDTVVMTNFEIFQELPKCDTETWMHDVGKVEQKICLTYGCHKLSIFNICNMCEVQ